MTGSAEGWSAWTADSGPSESLKPFTSTAEVPAVGHQAFADTGQVPAVNRRRPAPLPLRVALWSIVVLLVVGGAGLVIHRVRPAWLRHLEPAALASASAQTAHGHRTAASSALSAALVRQTGGGPSSADLAVGGSPFTVVVSAQATSWIQVTTPDAATPTFSSFLVAGAQKSFTSVNGQLGMMIGGSGVSVAVEVGGKLAQWQFTPNKVPFDLRFDSKPY